MNAAIEGDAWLQRAVLDELDWDPEIDSADVGVEVEDGIVTVSGSVGSYWKKIAAEQAAQRVSGVRGVANEIEVQPPGSGDQGDTKIVRAVANRLAWSAAVPGDRVDVAVDNGHVTLSGEVDTNSQKTAAEQIIRDIAGVSGVTNAVSVKASRVDETEIKEMIGAAFTRHALLDADGISVDLHDGAVTLRGSVSSWFERQEAERVAWGSGVDQVENELRVES